MSDSYFIRSFTKSRTILMLWYVVFCLALIALLNFGAFSAQTASLAIPRESVGFGAAAPPQPQTMVSIQETDSAVTTTTLDTIRKRFGRTLLVVDSVLIAFSVLFSYILSGLTLRPIRKTLQEQEEFAQEVSHELRTPLSVIGLELETLKRHKGSAPINTVQSISDEIERMNRLVDGLLTLVRPYDKSQHVSASAPFDITAAARKAFLQQQKVAKVKRLTYTFASDYDGTVDACENDIVQVIGILLDNAIKYTAKRGAVKLQISALGRKVHVSITDTGRGIAKKDLPHIFERFYRVPDQKASTEGGLGLGLAIAHKKAALNGATIKFESTLGKGTAAHVYVPIK